MSTSTSGPARISWTSVGAQRPSPASSRRRRPTTRWRPCAGWSRSPVPSTTPGATAPRRPGPGPTPRRPRPSAPSTRRAGAPTGRRGCTPSWPRTTAWRRAQARRPARAGRRLGGRVPAPAVPHHPPGPRGRGGGGPRQAGLRRSRAGPPLGGRRHPRADLERVRLPRRGPRRLQPSGGRLVDGRPPAHRAGPRRARDGAVEPEARSRAGPPLRPGLPVHVARVRAPVPGGGHRPVGGLGGRLLRRRRGGVVLRHARVRARRPARLPHPRRGPPGGLRLRGGVLQLPPAALRLGPAEPGPLRGGLEGRACRRGRSRPKPNTRTTPCGPQRRWREGGGITTAATPIVAGTTSCRLCGASAPTGHPSSSSATCAAHPS